MATYNMKLKPFQVPNFVILELPNRVRQEGFSGDTPTIPLMNLDVATLDEMCNEFRSEVFRKAGKQDPNG